MPVSDRLADKTNVDFTLTETIKREDVIKILRMYSLGERLRNTTSTACGAILQVAGRYVVEVMSIFPVLLSDSVFYTSLVHHRLGFRGFPERKWLCMAVY